jgi:hypothetical protein
MTRLSTRLGSCASARQAFIFISSTKVNSERTEPGQSTFRRHPTTPRSLRRKRDFARGDQHRLGRGNYSAAAGLWAGCEGKLRQYDYIVEFR